MKDDDVPAGKQLALVLYEHHAEKGETVAHTPLDLGFQRNNILIDLQDLSLGARRAIDVAYFLVANEPGIHKSYLVDLNFFKWLMGYSSRNRKHLAGILREGQKAAIIVQNKSAESGKERLSSVPLLLGFSIENAQIYFEVHDSLQQEIKSPSSFHFLSLRFIFRSLHAKILFDQLQPYLDAHKTPWFTLAEVRTMLCCKPGTYEEFKNFKRRVLDVALDQINEITNLKVTYITKNEPESRRVGSICFKIETEYESVAENSTMLALKSLYEVLHHEFGLSSAQFNKIMMNRDEWPNERLEQAIDYTRFNIKRGKVKSSAAGYFMKALEQSYRVAEADRIILEQQLNSLVNVQTQSGKVLGAPLFQSSENLMTLDLKAQEVTQQLTQKGEEGMEVLESLTQVTKQQALEDFARSDVGKLIMRRLALKPENLEAALVKEDWLRSTFGAYLLKKYSKPEQKA